MSKYQPLSDHLARKAGAEWRASFADLEKVLGFSLPKAARGAAWWKDGAHVRQWTEAGWAAEPDPAAGKVVFRKAEPKAKPKTEAKPEPAAAPPAVVGDEPPILKRLDVGPGWGMALVLGGVAVVAGLGALAFRGLRGKRSG